MKNRRRHDSGRSRSDDGRQLKLDVRFIVAKHELAERDLSEALDIDEGLVNRRLNPNDRGAHLQVVDLLRMPEAVQVDALRLFAARLGYELAPTKSGDALGIRHSAELLSSASATAIESINACDDGALDRAEALRIKPLAAKVRTVAAAIERQCDEAISSGVVSLKGGLS